MKDYVLSFISYLKTEKNASPNTVYDYRKEINNFIWYITSAQIVNLDSVTTPEIRKYIYHAKDKRSLCQSSVSKIIAIIKSFFNYLEQEEIISKNPSRKIRVPKKINRLPRVMSRFEVERVISSVGFAPPRFKKNSVRDRLILSMLYYTGIRRSELLSLDWDDLNLQKNTVSIRKAKGNKARIIPLHPILEGLLDDYLNIRLPLKDIALFTGESGKRLSKNSFTNIIRLYLKLSGLEGKGYSAHSFRHSFATHLIESGADIFKVQRLLGHENLDTTRVYINFNSSQLADAVEKL